MRKHLVVQVIAFLSTAITPGKAVGDSFFRGLLEKQDGALNGSLNL